MPSQFCPVLRYAERREVKPCDNGQSPNTLDPILIIGKNGIEENTIKQIKDSLEKRELIKIKILNSAGISDEDVLNRILIETRAEFVQFMGNKLTIYKKSKKKQKIFI